MAWRPALASVGHTPGSVNAPHRARRDTPDVISAAPRDVIDGRLKSPSWWSREAPVAGEDRRALGSAGLAALPAGPCEQPPQTARRPGRAMPRLAAL